MDWVVDFHTIDIMMKPADYRDKFDLYSRPLQAWDDYWVANPQRSDLIVCLTTIPTRLPYLSKTLKSLLYQTAAPQQIRLHMPAYSRREQRPYHIPKWLTALQGITIVPCEDLGPATKLLPALVDLPLEQPLLVLDDDRIYPRNLVAFYDRLAPQSTQRAVGLGGWVVPPDLTDRADTYRMLWYQEPPVSILSKHIRQPHQVDILMAFASYLVRPSFFDRAAIFDYTQAPEVSFFVDDVWISAHCTVPKYVLPNRRFSFVSWHEWFFYQKTALHRINNGRKSPEERHNTQLIRHFKDRWMCAS